MQVLALRSSLWFIRDALANLGKSIFAEELNLKVTQCPLWKIGSLNRVPMILKAVFAESSPFQSCWALIATASVCCALNMHNGKKMNLFVDAISSTWIYLTSRRSNLSKFVVFTLRIDVQTHRSLQTLYTNNKGKPRHDPVSDMDHDDCDAHI